MNFIQWLKETFNMSLEKFYECPDEKQIELEKAYREYLDNLEEANKI